MAGFMRFWEGMEQGHVTVGSRMEFPRPSRTIQSELLLGRTDGVMTVIGRSLPRSAILTSNRSCLVAPRYWALSVCLLLKSSPYPCDTILVIRCSYVLWSPQMLHEGTHCSEGRIQGSCPASRLVNGSIHILFYVCFCVKTPYCTYIVDSLTLHSRPATL